MNIELIETGDTRARSHVAVVSRPSWGWDVYGDVAHKSQMGKKTRRRRAMEEVGREDKHAKNESPCAPQKVDMQLLPGRQK